MSTTTATAAPPTLAGWRPPVEEHPPNAPAYGICGGAVLAGAAGAASLALVLLMLGVGLGLSAVSPWSGQGVTASAIGVSTILWLAFTQLAASGLGGYLAGRLRPSWAGVQADEVHFRDTAHGFLAWSVAALFTAGLLGGAIGSIVGAGAKTGTALAGTTAMAAAPAAQAASAMGDAGYFVDSLFRRDGRTTGPAASGSAAMPAAPDTPHPANTALPTVPATAEALKIFANAVGNGALPREDTLYLGQLVAQQTGMTQADAERRVADTFGRMQVQAEAARRDAQLTADTARKIAAKASLWGFVALLIGAFIASLAATFGGRHGDQFRHR